MTDLLKNPMPTNFEEAMKELELLVRSLESSQSSLEHAVALYERGVLLKRYCEQQLESAAMKIEKLNLDPNGVPIGKEPL